MATKTCWHQSTNKILMHRDSKEYVHGGIRLSAAGPAVKPLLSSWDDMFFWICSTNTVSMDDGRKITKLANSGGSTCFVNWWQWLRETVERLDVAKLLTAEPNDSTFKPVAVVVYPADLLQQQRLEGPQRVLWGRLCMHSNVLLQLCVG